MTPRSEPLLWLQLLGIAALPLEALAVLLLLGGSDPGPWPALERLFTWGIGSVLPALLFWRQPPDPFSLLLLQAPLRARRELQQRLSRLQAQGILRLALVLGCLAELVLLWWLDGHAALVAGPLAPLGTDQRLLALLLTLPLLALMLWQWQQILQSLWLLSRTDAAVEASAPMALAELEQTRLCLGLPLLLLSSLQPAAAPPDSALPVPVEPEQPAEENQGPDLDQQVP
ncbi:MAG: low-complexity tail membrane protein [Synechococcus sp.]|nr:low-complexity tail membrane protein [Synechococcus sp.]